jgi:predicted porin
MAGYTYPFSKRTNVYVGAGYVKHEFKYERTAPSKIKHQQVQVMTGLVHKF